MPEQEREVNMEERLSWDQYEVTKGQAEFLQEQDPELSEDDAWKQACDDDDAIATAWEDLLDEFTSWIKATGQEHWHAEVKNFGWRSIDGHKDFTATDATTMLRQVLPDTDCTFRIYKWGKDGFAINNAHHDSPAWAEWYYIRPQTDEDLG